MSGWVAAIGVAVVLAASLRLSASADSYPQLDELYARKQFFDLRDELQRHERDRSIALLFYRAAAASAFTAMGGSRSPRNRGN